MSPRRLETAVGFILLAPLLLAVTPSPGQSQRAGDLEEFLDSVRREAQRFRDVDVAIAEGYRRLGPDFPGMGEHWVQPGLVIAGELEPGRPPVLAYTPIDGKRALLGFAFTRVLDPGETPPDGPFPSGAWHDHTGGVDEESLLLSGPASMHSGREEVRLSMVHVWTEVANPDGVLAQNNWTLPFLRAGLPVPKDVSSEAARALSLTNLGLRFYELLLRDGIELDAGALEIVLGVLEAQAGEIRAWIDGRPAGTILDRSDVARLEAAWARIWKELEGRLQEDAWADLAVVRGHRPSNGQGTHQTPD